MSTLYFGKISKSKRPEQFSDGVIYASDSWMNGIQKDDYAFVLFNRKIALWKYIRKETHENNYKWIFEIINPDVGYDSKKFRNLKGLIINSSLVLLQRPSAGIGFHNVQLEKGLTAEDIVNNNYYLKDENFRAFKILYDNENIDKNSRDIQLIIKDNAINLFPSDFISSESIERFADRRNDSNGSRKFKDNTYKKINSIIQKHETIVSVNDLSFADFYDAFFCPYGEKSVNEEDDWWPSLEEYNPNISKEKWLEILGNRNLTTEQNLHVLACIYNYGGEATCKQLSLNYGESYNTYNSGASRYAENLVKANICSEPPYRDDGTNRWWPVLFVGRDAEKDIPGNYIWKLRDELKNACKEFGIEKWLKVKGDNKMNENVEKYKELLVENKNIILHGAPGTGKTFLAKEIVKAMNAEVGFCQFHPSYDYTDFVEGLRPTKNNGFERKDGVFKEFCANAVKNYIKYLKQPDELQDEEYFDYLYDSVLEDIQNLDIIELDVPNRNNKTSVGIQNNRICYGNDKRNESETNIKSMFLYLFKNKIDCSEWKNKDYSNLISSLTNGKVKILDYTFYHAILCELLARSKKQENVDIKKKTSEVVSLKKFVFIIDEINRGELSKIFGELFFSIDPSYRGLDENGKPKGLVKSQYQNLVDDDDVFADGFYIPENVYIIGTMNDIDRSVESMDFAMRRRFIFKEVTAEESADNMQLPQEVKNRMNRINDQISATEGLNSAYHIGGAYFRNVTDFDKLWNLKLSSLVKEYLRGMDDDDSKYKKIKNAYFDKSETSTEKEIDTGNTIEDQ